MESVRVGQESMIKKAKRKIAVLLYVIFIIAFFTVLLTFYTAHKESNKSEIERQLSHYARNVRAELAYQRKIQEQGIITGAALSEDSQTSQLSEIYTVKEDKQGELTVLKKGKRGQLSKKKILRIAGNILEQDAWKGKLGHFQYKLSRSGEEKLIVFTDISFLENQQKHMVFFMWNQCGNACFMGGCCLCDFRMAGKTTGICT